MSNILVTGSSGFIGRALVKRLLKEENTVFEFDRHHGDISNQNSLGIFDSAHFDHVFHLAGKTFVPDSWEQPFSFFQVNVMGTINILEYCRKNNVSLTYVSSYLYGEPDYLPIDENHQLKSYNPYSQSKLVADCLCQFYINNYGVKITIIRPFNIYGPNQSKLFLIPEIIKNVISPEINVIHIKDLTPKRDFLYLDDFIDALFLTITKPYGIYNVGSGYSISVEDIIQIIMKSAGIDKPVHCQEEPRKNEIKDLYADISKAKSMLDWMPRISLYQGIEECLKQV